MPLAGLDTLRREEEITAIKDLRHPHYVLNQENWEKWRLAFLGGTKFMKRYLRKFGKREDDDDYFERLQMSYSPSFAKIAIAEVKNSLFQRIGDVTRLKGPKSYQDAILGLNGGVDLNGSSMNIYMGRDIIPELLVMGRVGVFVDMPFLEYDLTISESGSKHPYLYWYKAEDIRSWAYYENAEGSAKEFKAVLLRDNVFDINPHWNLPYELMIRYRYVWIGEDGFVRVRFYTQDGNVHYPDNIKSEDDNGTIRLNIRRIPFTMLEISDSLMTDVADYQIALLNLASSDMNFALKANFPFYTEQFDWKTQSPYLKQEVPGSTINKQSHWNPQDSTIVVSAEKTTNVKVGVTQGRRYPIGTERPGFIAPPTDSLMASMAKQEKLKEEIRQLVFLAVASLAPTQKQEIQDKTGLEAGLSYIGQELQHAEHRIADFWAMYLAEKPAEVAYPKDYDLKSDTERRENAEKLAEIIPQVPSITFQREVAKDIAKELLIKKVDPHILSKIYSEIDKAPVVNSNPDVIKTDLEGGLVSLETASMARGYQSGEVEKAKQDHAERLARIAESQGALDGGSGDPASRGVSDGSANPKAPPEEKTSSQKDQTTKDTVKTRVRGAANDSASKSA